METQGKNVDRYNQIWYSINNLEIERKRKEKAT